MLNTISYNLQRLVNAKEYISDAIVERGSKATHAELTTIFYVNTIIKIKQFSTLYL